jgi:hypothetical protein
MRVTVGKFQELHKIDAVEMDEVDKAMLIAQVVTGKSAEEVGKMNPKKFSKVCQKANKLLNTQLKEVDDRKPDKLIRVNGRWYQLHYDITRMDAGRYVELTTFGSQPIDNLHKMLASMAVPLRWTWRGLRAKPYDADRHSEIAEEMKDADFSTAYHALVFFYAVLNDLIASLNTSGNPAQEELLDRLLRLSLRISGGFITARWYQNLRA